MERSGACKSCRKKTLVTDDETGKVVCTSCGIVQEFDNFQAHIGGITGETGTYVRVGSVGIGGTLNYKEAKIFEAQKLINDFIFKLGLSGSKSNEVKLLVEQITDGEYGRGRWFPVFVGACAYVVMRKDNKMLPVVEVADMVGCDVFELGRMIGRVVDFVDLKLPEFDIVNSFERAIRSCPSFSNVPAELVTKMLQQGVFLVQCLIKWFITTGRRPMPVVAAVLVFVGELNQLPVTIEDVARELLVAAATCKKRYKELLEKLVVVARVLPWGKDVTLKNILKNAPFVLQYMELKSSKNCDRKKKIIEHVQCDMEELIDDCLHKEIGYGSDASSTEDFELPYFEDRADKIGGETRDKFHISPECLTVIYSNFLDKVPHTKRGAVGGKGSKRKKLCLDFQICTDWWKGQSELSKKLLLLQILDKDVGLDANPPSFDRGVAAKKQRLEKIRDARLRIRRIMQPLTSYSSSSNDVNDLAQEISKKRKRMVVDIDWEDLIIETLILHGVEDEEIENGHYNVLLALHVFDDGLAYLASGKWDSVLPLAF